MGQVAELRVIKEQLKEKQEVLVAEMEVSRREKEAQAEEVNLVVNKLSGNHTFFYLSVPA